MIEGLTPATVELRGLVKKFGRDVVAVDSVDMLIERGELITFLGPSGCGKTTTLRLIAGLERPTAGQILLDAEDVARLPAYLRDITMVFQSYALFPHMNVFENVAYGVRVARRPAAEIRTRVGEALEMGRMPRRGLPPVIVLVSDGQPDDPAAFDKAMKRLLAEPWGKRAVRVAVAIGQDAHVPTLEAFVANPEVKVVVAKDAAEIVQMIRLATVTATQTASRPVRSVPAAEPPPNVF